MTVTCKSLTAKMHKDKFESGSKGKCIVFKKEWITPNSFQEIAGSKSKKYLASIKFLGRPLIEYVQIGELEPKRRRKTRKRFPASEFAKKLQIMAQKLENDKKKDNLKKTK